MRYLAIILAVLLLTSSVQAASFDCKKASTAVEKAICSDSQLSKLDEELGKVYKSALSVIAEKESLKAEQRKWIQFRNTIPDTETLIKVYKARIDVLKPLEASNLKKMTIIGDMSIGTGVQGIDDYIFGSRAVTDKVLDKCSAFDRCKIVAMVSRNEDTEYIESALEVTSLGTIVLKFYGKQSEKNDRVIKKNKELLKGKVVFDHNAAGGNYSFDAGGDKQYIIKYVWDDEVGSDKLDKLAELAESNKIYNLSSTIETYVDGSYDIDASADIYILEP